MITTHSASEGEPPERQMRADARRSRAALLEAATKSFTENGADAPLDDIARRAGVGIGTLYRHFPSRLDLQEAVYRSQVEAVCAQGRELAASPSSWDAFSAWVRILGSYFVTKRGVASALIAAGGRDSEVVSSCSVVLRETASRLLRRAQDAGVVRADLTEADVMMVVHGIIVATEREPEKSGPLLSLMLDGMRAR